MTSDINDFTSQYSKGTLHVRMIELENGLLVLLSDSENYRLGQTAMAIPPGHGRSEPTSAGVFAGAMDSALIRTIAERVAASTGKTSMVISGLREMTREIMLEVVIILKNHLVV